MANQTYSVSDTNVEYAAQTKSASKTTTREVTSLVLGIISLYLVLSGSIPVLGYLIALVLSIIGAVQGNRARKEATQSSFLSQAGFVCSVVAIVLSALMLVGMIIIATTAGIAIGEAAESLPNILNSIGA